MHTQLVEHLHKLGKGEILPYYVEFGLCAELKYIGSPFTEGSYIKSHISYWEEYSGNRNFPVAHPDIAEPEKAYQEIGNLWQPNEDSTLADREYIASRLRLCLWLAKEIENGRI